MCAAGFHGRRSRAGQPREPGLQRDEGLHDLPRSFVRHTDHGGLGHGGVFDQSAFHLKGADQVARGLDQIVRAADEPVIPVAVAHRQIAGQVPAAREAFRVALRLAQIGAHHRGPARPQGQFADLAIRQFGNCLAVTADDPGLDSRQRLAHRARLDVHIGRVGDHDAACFRLPPIVVEGQPEDLLPPKHTFRVQRFAHAGEKSQGREIASCRRFVTCPHHHADGGGCCVPDLHAFAF